MSYRKMLPVVLLFFCFGTRLTAQPSGNPSTAVILKTASTLLQAHQLDAAEGYFKQALQKATAARNRYQQAQAWEGLANVYGRNKQQTEAIAAYQNAIKLYTGLGFTVIADVLNGQMRSLLGMGDLYAGIEIGAKGIKLSVIDIKVNNGEAEYSLKLDTSINTDAAALSYQSEKETLDAISVLYHIITSRFDIPAGRIHIVISSGLRQELDKYNKTVYFANIVRPKELDPKIRISYITLDQEAELSFKGIVPQSNRYTANQLDVGSANTKGGFISSSRTFIPVTFPVGTKTFQKLVEARVKNSPGMSMFDFRTAAEKLIIDSLGRQVIYYFQNRPEFKSREVEYISGGIVWCIASLMHPEKIRDNQVEISLQDITDFQNMVCTDFETLSKPEFPNSMKPEDVAASMDNIKRVLNTYDQKALLAGSLWLGELVKQQANTQSPGKKLIYPRYAYVGWISGYIMDKISKQYTEMASN